MLPPVPPRLPWSAKDDPNLSTKLHRHPPPSPPPRSDRAESSYSRHHSPSPMKKKEYREYEREQPRSYPSSHRTDSSYPRAYDYDRSSHQSSRAYDSRRDHDDYGDSLYRRRGGGGGGGGGRRDYFDSERDYDKSYASHSHRYDDDRPSQRPRDSDRSYRQDRPTLRRSSPRREPSKAERSRSRERKRDPSEGEEGEVNDTTLVVGNDAKSRSRVEQGEEHSRKSKDTDRDHDRDRGRDSDRDRHRDKDWNRVRDRDWDQSWERERDRDRNGRPGRDPWLSSRPVSPRRDRKLSPVSYSRRPDRSRSPSGKARIPSRRSPSPHSRATRWTPSPSHDTPTKASVKQLAKYPADPKSSDKYKPTETSSGPEHSSPSQAGNSTPRPDILSPTTTVDSKISASDKDTKLPSANADTVDGTDSHKVSLSRPIGCDPNSGNPNSRDGSESLRIHTLSSIPSNSLQSQVLSSSQAPPSGPAALRSIETSSPSFHKHQSKPVDVRPTTASTEPSAPLSTSTSTSSATATVGLWKPIGHSTTLASSAASSHIGSNRTDSAPEPKSSSIILSSKKSSGSSSLSGAVSRLETDAVPPPPPLVPLPNELDQHVKKKNFQIEYDPELSKSKRRGRERIYRAPPLPDNVVKDPRKTLPNMGRRHGSGAKFYRETFPVVKYAWDANSVGPRPPPPPTSLLVIGLSPLVTPATLVQHFRLYGRIDSSELKINPRTGQSMGIFSITFVHDFDQKGNVVPTLSSSEQAQNGNIVASAALKATTGTKFKEVAVTVTYDRDRQQYNKAWKAALAKPNASSTVATTSSAKANGSTSAASALLANKLSSNASPALGRSTPTQKSGKQSSTPATPNASDNPPSSSMAPPAVPRGSQTGFGKSSYHDRRSGYEDNHATKYSDSRGGSGRPSSYLCNSDSDYDHRRQSRWSDDEDDLPQMQASRRNYLGRTSHTEAGRTREEGHSDARERDQVENTSVILGRLAEIGNPYLFLPKAKSADIGISSIRSFFSSFSPTWIAVDDQGWYLAFSKPETANRCKMVHENAVIESYRISVLVRSPANIPTALDPFKAGADVATDGGEKKMSLRGIKVPSTAELDKKEWTIPELTEAATQLIVKELVEGFVRDVKNRIVSPFIADFLRPTGIGGQILSKPLPKKTGTDSLATSAQPDDSLSSGKLPSFKKKPGTEGRRNLSDFSIPKKPQAVKKEAVKADALNKIRRGSKDTPSVHTASDAETLSADEDGLKKRRKGRVPPSSRPKPSRDARRRLLDWSDDGSDDDGTAASEETPSRSASVSVEARDTNGADTIKAVTYSQDDTLEGKNATADSRAKKITRKKVVKRVPQVKGADLESAAEIENGTSSPVIPVTKKSKVAKTAASLAKDQQQVTDPFAAGLVEDSKDLYYLKTAIQRIREGLTVNAEEWPESVKEDDGEGDEEDGGEYRLNGQVEETLQQRETGSEADSTEAGLAKKKRAVPKHSTGSARTEGFYRISPAEKAIHLPDRNEATQDEKSVGKTVPTHVLTSARNNRADSRRLVLGIEQHKKETATDTDIFKFNQLRSRKKQLKFSKSPIHDWGLYAMETIPAGDMIIEYVGEVIRQQVADEREKRYEKQGNFSTYLFRVDDDLVVDATHKGNIARLMNHSCQPNCTAKILTLNGEKKIVLFAKTVIHAGIELTYDYKFQSSGDDEDAIPCLCGATGCRRFL